MVWAGERLQSNTIGGGKPTTSSPGNLKSGSDLTEGSGATTCLSCLNVERYENECGTINVALLGLSKNVGHYVLIDHRFDGIGGEA